MNPSFCIDTGAPLSVIGLKELRRVFSGIGKRLKGLRPSHRRFKFADAAYGSLGCIDLPLATPSGINTIYVSTDVVAADVPALLGLSTLDQHSLLVDTVMNKLSKREVIMDDLDKAAYSVEIWNVPLTRHGCHVYADMGFTNKMYFTSTQLKHLHRQFCHPSSDKLYKLLKRARPEDTSPETL